ncbi:GNAT family N-acetyltransferase [Nesterenkonia suensis]
MSSAYRWSTIVADDVEAWADLVNHLAEVDGTEEFYAAEDLAEELDSSQLDPARDTIAVWADGQLVAFGKVAVKSTPDRDGLVGAQLDGGVHDGHRRRGLGTELMARLEARAAEKAGRQHGQVEGYFGVGGARAGSSTQAFHESRGYDVARWFNLMARPLTAGETAADVLDGRAAPPGVRFRRPGPDDEAAVREAHAAAFADHWGSAPPDPARWQESWTARSTRHEVSRLAVDDDGAVLAYALASQWEDRAAYLELVGTVPSARGTGMASAVLAESIAAAAATGDYDLIELDVDSDSLTGATRIYERLGFALKFATSAMRRPVTFGGTA